MSDTGLAVPAAGSGLSADEAVRRLYGPGLAIYLDHPEIGPLLRQAAGEGWAPARLQSALTATEWWKTNDATKRQWEDLKVNDPATAESRRAQKAAQINDEVKRLGFSPAEGMGWSVMLAEDAIRFGWNDAQLRDVIVSYVPPAAPGKEPSGSIGVTVARFKDVARSYHLNLSGQKAESYARRVALGELTEEAVIVSLRQQAKAKYPFLSEQIDNGITPDDYFSEYQSTLSQILELPEQAIDFVLDPRFRAVTDFVDKDGRRRAMTLTEAADHARALPDYAGTGGAEKSVASLGLFLGEKFGRSTA